MQFRRSQRLGYLTEIQAALSFREVFVRVMNFLNRSDKTKGGLVGPPYHSVSPVKFMPRVAGSPSGLERVAGALFESLRMLESRRVSRVG